jgi:uncharacterized membrane protein (DUF106 family)
LTPSFIGFAFAPALQSFVNNFFIGDSQIIARQQELQLTRWELYKVSRAGDAVKIIQYESKRVREQRTARKFMRPNQRTKAVLSA